MTTARKKRKKHGKKAVRKSLGLPVGSLERLINGIKEAKDWTWEKFAEKVRRAGMSCTSRSLYRWGQGLRPHANNESLLRDAIKKLR